MTSENGNNMYMPVAPAYGYGGGNGMFGDGNGAWWLLILLIALGGWGNGFGGGYGGGGMFPWLMNGQANGVSDVQRGFDQNAVITGITGVQNAVTSGFGNVQTALCNGFAGVNAGIANGFAQAEIAANSRQMTDMNQNFQLQSSLQNCCCENRAATADLKYTMATESAATRANCDANNQKILDKLCQLELDGVKQNYEGQIRALQSQLIAEQNANQALRFAASQGTQTATIQSGQRALANEVEQYVLPTPRPAYIVQNPNCCQPGYGCGCGGYAA